MIGALILGLAAGALGRAIIPGDPFEGMTGAMSWVVSLVLGLAGALLGYLIFTVLFGIGDTDVFDWGGIVGAVIGVLIIIPLAGLVMRRRGITPPGTGKPGAP